MDIEIKSTPKEFLSELKITPFLMILTFIITYYFLFSSLGLEQTIDGKPTSKGAFLIVEIIMWSIFVLLITINALTYMFDIDIIASGQNLFLKTPKIEHSIIPSKNMNSPKQVFHVSNNKYSYEESKAICSAYDSRLATWKEVDKAYDKGADWCSMGWSDGQMALYPTQQDKWSKLQDIEGHEQDCGRPGVNGGYIANPNVRFGVNCYGFKPEISREDKIAMKMAPLYPSTRREHMFDKEVDYWRNKLPTLKVSPFNHNKWSIL